MLNGHPMVLEAQVGHFFTYGTKGGNAECSLKEDLERTPWHFLQQVATSTRRCVIMLMYERDDVILVK